MAPSTTREPRPTPRPARVSRSAPWCFSNAAVPDSSSRRRPGSTHQRPRAAEPWVPAFAGTTRGAALLLQRLYRAFPGGDCVLDVVVGVGRRDVIFLLALQDAALAQQRVEAARHRRVAGQRAAIIADRLVGEHDIEQWRLAADLRRDAGPLQQIAERPHQLAAGSVESFISARPT